VFKIQKNCQRQNVGKYQQECMKKTRFIILSKSKVLLPYFFSAPLQNLSISLK
jgi:hypothetical protein